MSKEKKNSIHFRVVHENGDISEFEFTTHKINMDEIIEVLEFLATPKAEKSNRE